MNLNLVYTNVHWVNLVNGRLLIDLTINSNSIHCIDMYHLYKCDDSFRYSNNLQQQWNPAGFTCSKSTIETQEQCAASFLCLYFYLWTHFTHCSGVSIVNFEQVNADWEAVYFVLVHGMGTIMGCHW